jgi:AraC-like DNA-binding protein
VDPLSQIFALFEVRSVATARFEAGGDWALQFPAKPYLKFNAVLRGSCWITIPDIPPIKLRCGDTFLMTDAPQFVLSSAPDLTAQEAAPVLLQEPPNILRFGGDETVLIGGGFIFADSDTQFLRHILPAFMHIPAQQEMAEILRTTLGMLDQELSLHPGQMGASVMTRRLADILLVQGLRAYSKQQAGAKIAGWIGALADRHIGKVLFQIHNDIARHWTLGDLANIAGMSRSGFALRFKTLVGEAPLAYIGMWRMQVARTELRNPKTPVIDIATRLGYGSESAFGNAFKRAFGTSPRRYWQEYRQNGPAFSTSNANLLSPGR